MIKDVIKFEHPVYGLITIDEPVFVEIINEHYFQRLKGIDQGGYKPLLVKPKTDLSNFRHTRYAHSLGVLTLLKQYGASIEEQMAGLLHDVSHFAFSHCADYALAGGSEKKHDLQDNLHESYIKKQTNLEKILSRYGYDIDFILDDENFPLKEKLLPDLCADRIDYSLQTAVVFGEIDKIAAQELLSHLQAEEGQWVFDDFNFAKKYTELFYLLNKKYFSSVESGAMFAIIGDVLKYALKSGYINEKDFWTEDQEIIAKIKKNAENDEKMRRYWDLMNRKYDYTEDMSNFDRLVHVKVRLVDPFFRDGVKIERVSDVDHEFKKRLAEAPASVSYYIKYNW